jgi:uncharacterized protein
VRLILLGSALLLFGCAHSPDPTFFALSARSGNAVQSRALKIELRRTALPGYLDRPHIVRRASAERLELGGDERWGAPLEEMLSGTLAEDLAQRLPACVIYTEGGAISAAADVRVEVQLFRFERMADGVVQLVAEVAVHPEGAPARLQRFDLQQKPASARTADVVVSLSALVARLSDGIAQIILRAAT